VSKPLVHQPLLVIELHMKTHPAFRCENIVEIGCVIIEKIILAVHMIVLQYAEIQL
jgi:hypothetical protein